MSIALEAYLQRVHLCGIDEYVQKHPYVPNPDDDDDDDDDNEGGEATSTRDHDQHNFDPLLPQPSQTWSQLPQLQLHGFYTHNIQYNNNNISNITFIWLNRCHRVRIT